MTDRPGEDKDPLDKALQQWRVTSSLPPRFQEKVWQRIESDERTKLNVGELLQRWVASIIPRPAFAASYVGILIAVGFIAGTWQAQEHKARAGQAFERKYVQLVDPYQAPREPKP